MRDTIIKAMGNLSVAAKTIGCSRTTLYEWIRKDKIEDAIQEGRDQLLDMAENKLASNIKDGKETSLIFYLKTQGRDRGYFEKKEVDQKNSGEMTITVKRKIIKGKDEPGA